MSNDAYKKLASVLYEMPNGLPSTDDGLEIRLLQKIFDPDEAEIFCNLQLKFETAGQIESISLIRKPEDQIDTPPADEMALLEKRAQLKGMNSNRFK